MERLSRRNSTEEAPWTPIVTGQLCVTDVARCFLARLFRVMADDDENRSNTSQTMVRSLAIGDYDPMCPKMIYIRNEDYILSIDVEPESSFFASLCALL